MAEGAAMAEVCYGAPTGLADAAVLTEAANELAGLCDIAAREEAVRTVFRLVDSVLAAPEDASKRRVRKANAAFHQKVGRHPAALQFLLAAGFQEGEESASAGEAVLTMPVAYISRLTDAHHELARAAQEAGLTAPPLPSGAFNPYQSSCQRTDTTSKLAAPTAWQSAAEQRRQEVKKREAEQEEMLRCAPAVSLRPTSFWLAAGRRIEDAIRETAELPAEDAGDKALLLSKVAGAKAATGGSGGKFESADKGRLAELARTRIHQICVLRVICPDKSVLQAHFRAADTGEHVMAQLAPFLAPQVRSAGWYLYQSPPVRRLAAKETLAAAGLTPGANLYLGFESAKVSSPYLEHSLASKLGPPPQAQQKAPGASDFATTATREDTFAGQGRMLGDSDTSELQAANAPGRSEPPVSSMRVAPPVNSLKTTASFSAQAPPANSLKSTASFSATQAGGAPVGALQRTILSKDKNLKAGMNRSSFPPADMLDDPLVQDSAVKPGLFLGLFPICCPVSR